MKKGYRIKKNKEFQQIFKKGKSFANRQFVVYYLQRSDQKHFRVGFSVGKKIGNAVVRNRIKRYLRETFIEYEEQIPLSYDIVIIARQQTKEMGYEQIKRSLTHVLSKARLLKK